MSSKYLHKARDFQIAGGSFNQVQGDQINYTTTIVEAKEKEPTEFDEFYHVKRGAIRKLKDIGCSAYPRRWDDGDRYHWEEGQPRADRTICTTTVLQQSGKVFTLVQYSGPDARTAFLEDFRRLSRIITSHVSQIYGYNQSVPSLILYTELVPVAHLNMNDITRRLGRIYLSGLLRQWGCKSNELWLDSGRGMICRGPPGPGFAMVWPHEWGAVDFPSTAELLQDDVLLRFLASLKSKRVDRIVLQELQGQGRLLPERVTQPTVISTLTNTPFAVLANNVWESAVFPGVPIDANLSDRKLLANRLIRFTLAGPPYFLLVLNNGVQSAWLSQAWSIFHACKIASEENLRIYNLVYPYVALEPSWQIECSEAQLQRQSRQAIYLFVRIPPSDMLDESATSSLHYWSLDEDGHSSLPDDKCYELGLPIQALFTNMGGFGSVIWHNDTYKHMKKYQVLRGFDPFTTDFARHLGLNDLIFRPVGNLDQSTQQGKDGPSTPASEIPNSGDQRSPSRASSPTLEEMVNLFREVLANLDVSTDNPKRREQT
ncbi:hypothetical protein PM082_007790 [Marasmius tenuissimus]|nr:hypothetical protein PM082_007790 [Marasmius tenuissimus]